MKVGIVGLGLIGGSIFKKLSKYTDLEVIGISSSVKDFENITNDFLTIKNCDFVFVCTPMNKTLEILDKLNTFLDKKTLVTDVCSLKEFVSQKEYNYRFIPSHPMAGTEHSGWENSFAELFKDAKWVITPTENNTKDDINILENMINLLGAKPVITTAKEHDKAVALISHMPMFLAQALCMNIKDNELAQAIASSGFRDTTRLALSNTEMAGDMVNMNKENIVKSLESLKESITVLLDENYKEKAEEIKRFRKNLYD